MIYLTIRAIDDVNNPKKVLIQSSATSDPDMIIYRNAQEHSESGLFRQIICNKRGARLRMERYAKDFCKNNNFGSLKLISRSTQRENGIHLKLSYAIGD